MGVDAVGRAGEQGYIIFSRYNLKSALQRLHIILIHHIKNLVHLIGQRLIQYMNIKFISPHHLVDIGKQTGAGQSSVGRQNAVGILPADRQLRAVHMANTGLQHILRRTMVNGKLYINSGNRQISHHSVTGNVQHLPVFRTGQVFLQIAESVSVYVVAGQGFVKISGQLPLSGIVLRLQNRHRLFIAGNQLTLPVGVPLVGDRRVGKNAKPCQENQPEQQIQKFSFHDCSSGSLPVSVSASVLASSDPHSPSSFASQFSADGSFASVPVFSACPTDSVFSEAAFSLRSR